MNDAASADLRYRPGHGLVPRASLGAVVLPFGDDLLVVGGAASALRYGAAGVVAGEIGWEVITFTNGADMDSVLAGEYFHLLFMRDAQASTDNMAADASLVFIEIRET